MRVFRLALLAGLLCLMGIARSAQAQDVVVTYVVFAENEGNLSYVADALNATGLSEDLEDGEYTFFAPTDRAWEDLPEDIRNALFDPENRDELKEVLKYNIVEGEFDAQDLKARGSHGHQDGVLINLRGDDLHVSGTQEGFLIESAAILKPDVETTEGLVHVIDKVILPPTLDLATEAQ